MPGASHQDCCVQPPLYMLEDCGAGSVEADPGIPVVLHGGGVALSPEPDTALLS